MARVFVVQCPRRKDALTGEWVPRYDLGAAGIYGDLIEMLSPTAKPFDSEPIIEDLERSLYDYSDDDYLLCIGNPILIGMASIVAASFNDGRVRWLQWHGVRGEYIPVEADFGFTTDAD
jgi:hypothetical protein